MNITRRSSLVPFAVCLRTASGRIETEKQQRARRLGREIIALGTILMFVSLTAWPQEALPSGPKVTLGIEITLSDGSVFYIPAVGDGEVSGIVPLTINHFTAIRHYAPHAHKFGSDRRLCSAYGQEEIVGSKL
jgi:hypothetical protein